MIKKYTPIKDLLTYGTQVSAIQTQHRMYTILVCDHGRVRNITREVADLIGSKCSHDGIYAIEGFTIVQELSYTLHGRKDRGPAGHATLPHEACEEQFHAGYTLQYEFL